MSNELEKLMKNQTKLLSTLTDNIALLRVQIGRLDDKLAYHKQWQEERFIPPSEPAVPGITPNRGED